MSNTYFNPITETYTVKHKSDKNKLFENVFGEVSSNDENRDLVLMCGKEKLSYHSEVVAAVFPFLKKFVQNSKTCPCSLYIQNKAEIFISLDGVDPKVFKQMMSCIYGNIPMRFPRKTLGEVRDIFKMLGADDKLFSIEKDESERPEARNGDVFRNVLGAATAGTLDITIKRKGCDGDDSERVAKKRVVDINMQEDDPVPMKQDEPINTDDISMKPKEAIPDPSQSIETALQPAKPAVAPIERLQTETISFTPKLRDAVPTQKLNDNNLQMFLPHLTVTTIKQELKEPSETANSVPMIKLEPVEYTEATSNPADSDSSMLRCPLALCSSEILFKTRSEILLHLTQAHFTESLLELFPFTKGQPCKICVDEKRPRVLIAQIRNRHIAHIGVNHGIVLDLLPAELKEILMVLPQRIKGLSTSRPETPMSKPVDITLDEAPAPVVAAPKPPAQSYPSNYNFNYPTNTNYPQHNQAPTNYPDQGNYPTYPPVNYPTYPDYSQYPTQPPVYPSYPDTSFEAHSASQVKFEPVPQPIKEESRSAVKEEPKVVIKQEPLDHSESVYKCTLCTARSFNQRSDLLFHLSITHFSRNLNQLFPFKDNQVCSLCNQFKPKNMSSHISHVGLKHEEVIKLLPPDLASSLAPAGNMNTKSSCEKPVEKAPFNNETAEQEKQPMQKPTEIPVAFAPPASDPEEPTVQCSLCQANNKVRLFTKRSEFLKHLSLLHFGKTLLQAFPFAEGQNCNLCFETSKKMYTPSKKEVHVCHVGVLHAKIFELLPKEILQQVRELPTLKKVSALDRAMPNPQAGGQQPQAEQKPLQPIHGTGEVPPTQSVKTDVPTPIPVQFNQAQSFATPSLPPSVTPGHNFTLPAPAPVNAPPRDVAFNVPTTNLPPKDEFKLPMMKTDKPYNCRYCVSGFDVAKDLKDHLLTHKSQFSQINQTPRKGNSSSLVHLRMNTPRK